jgi:hypothetical protein
MQSLATNDIHGYTWFDMEPLQAQFLAKERDNSILQDMGAYYARLSM